MFEHVVLLPVHEIRALESVQCSVSYTVDSFDFLVQSDPYLTAGSSNQIAVFCSGPPPLVGNFTADLPLNLLQTLRPSQAVRF